MGLTVFISLPFLVQISGENWNLEMILDRLNSSAMDPASYMCILSLI